MQEKNFFLSKKTVFVWKFGKIAVPLQIVVICINMR